MATLFLAVIPVLLEATSAQRGLLRRAEPEDLALRTKQPQSFLEYVTFLSGYWSYLPLMLLIPALWSMACGSCCFNAGDRKQGKDCALCGLYQPISRLTRHQSHCAIRHEGFLDSLPAAASSVPCASCGRQPLRLWPSHKSTRFKCALQGVIGATNAPSTEAIAHNKTGSLCESRTVGGWLINEGDNWYTCFGCGYDICVNCVNRKMGEAATATAAAIEGHCDVAAARISLDTFGGEGNSNAFAVVAIPEATITEILSDGKDHPRGCSTNFPCNEEHFVAVEEDWLSIGDSVLTENIELPPSYQDAACMV